MFWAFTLKIPGLSHISLYLRTYVTKIDMGLLKSDLGLFFEIIGGKMTQFVLILDVEMLLSVRQYN